MANSEILKEIEKLESIKKELLTQLTLEESEEGKKEGEEKLAELDAKIDEWKESLAKATTPAMMVNTPTVDEVEDEEPSEEEDEVEDEEPSEEELAKIQAMIAAAEEMAKKTDKIVAKAEEEVKEEAAKVEE
jgi:hypothetical protein